MQNNMWWAGMILSKLGCMQTARRAFLRHDFFNSNRTIVRTMRPEDHIHSTLKGTQGTMGNYFVFYTTKKRQGC